MKKVITLIFAIMLFASFTMAQQQKPPLIVTIEPTEGEHVVYAPVAARSSSHKATGQIALLLKIGNTSGNDLKLTRVSISYDGTGIPLTTKDITNDRILPLTIPRRSSAYWNQVRHESNDVMYDTMVYLPENAQPNLITINLKVEGYSQTFSVMKALKKHTSPVAGGGYLFPGKAKDMYPGEYWYTGTGHSTSNWGSQLFAYDMGVRGWNDKTNSYTETYPDTNGCKNTDYRVYGRAIYAMADGTVLRWADNVKENPAPWRLLGDTKKGCTSQAEKEALDCSVLPANTGGGNYISIASNGEVNGYAHFQEGSMNPALKRKGARVKAGDYLGRVGNTGCSTAPHLHFEAGKMHDAKRLETTNDGNHPDVVSLRPIGFRDAYTIDASLLTGRDPQANKWTKLNGQALPRESSLIWGDSSKPCYYTPGISEIAMHGVSRTDYQPAFDRATGCGYYPESIDGFRVNGNSYYNMIFRYAPGKVWFARHNESMANFNKEREDAEKKGFRLVYLDVYGENSDPRHAYVMVKDGGPATKLTLSLSVPQHEAKFDELKAQGWRPIRVSSFYMAGNIRFVTTLYEKRATGAFEMKSHLTAAEYKALFDENWNKKKVLVHLDAYLEGGSPRYAAIWHTNVPLAALSAKHKLSASEYQAQYNDHISKGYLTRIVTGYELNNKMAFEGVWAK